MKAYEKLKKDSDKQAEKLRRLQRHLKNAEALSEAGQWETVTIRQDSVKVGDGDEMEVLNVEGFRRDLRVLIARYCDHEVPSAVVEEILAMKPAIWED